MTDRPVTSFPDMQDKDGGTIGPAQPLSLPDGIIAVALTHYLVGPYIYTSLEDALAEHGRQSAK